MATDYRPRPAAAMGCRPAPVVTPPGCVESGKAPWPGTACRPYSGARSGKRSPLPGEDIARLNNLLMKNHSFIALAVVLGLAAFPLTHGAENSKPANPAADEPVVAAASWSELKGYTYDQRELFLAAIKGLEGRVDAQITELADKRATMDANNTRTKEWDFAMQEMGSARTNLISTSEDMAKATRDTWDQRKDRVGLAWVRTQDAYAKVKASTTN